MSAPPNEKTPACKAGAFQKTLKNGQADSTPAQKRLATLTAKFALAGHQVIETDRDDFMVTRWGLVRYCKDYAALQEFARQAGILS